jgi:hypothetical protein
MKIISGSGKEPDKYQLTGGREATCQLVLPLGGVIRPGGDGWLIDCPPPSKKVLRLTAEDLQVTKG